MRDTSQMVYERGSFGGRSSPISQPIVFSVVSGSGPSQSKHWNVRLPLPRGGSANVSGGLKSVPVLGGLCELGPICRKPEPKVTVVRAHRSFCLLTAVFGLFAEPVAFV